MALTTAQLGTLKSAIIADPVAGPIRALGDSTGLQAWCNGPSTTSAWRTRVPATDIYDAHKPDEYIARSIPERGAFDLMCDPARFHDFTVQAKRNGVGNIFSGTAQSTSRGLIFAAAQELATNAQVILGGTPGSVGGFTGMSEIITAQVRNYPFQISLDEANRLVN